MVDALGAHVPGEDAAVGGEAGDGDADVVVDLEDLLLVGGELVVGLVDAGQDDVGPGSEADRGGALLHGLHGVLHLEEPPRGAPGGHVRVVLVPEHGSESQGDEDAREDRRNARASSRSRCEMVWGRQWRGDE